MASLAASAAIVLVTVPLRNYRWGPGLATVMLPSASVFLLLLCNDKAVFGPWVNTTRRNVFTATVIWVLALLSLALTASTMFSDLSSTTLQLGIGCAADDRGLAFRQGKQAWSSAAAGAQTSRRIRP